MLYSRPVYETAKDRLNEEQVAKRYIELTGLAEAAKLSKQYRLDYAALDSEGKIVQLFEVKCRNVPHDKYDTLMLSAAKVKTAAEWYSIGLPCGLVVQWTDRLGVIDMLNHTTYRMGGRWDRNDPQDIEPVTDYLISDFTWIDT